MVLLQRGESAIRIIGGRDPMACTCVPGDDQWTRTFRERGTLVPQKYSCSTSTLNMPCSELVLVRLIMWGVLSHSRQWGRTRIYFPTPPPPPRRVGQRSLRGGFIPESFLGLGRFCPKARISPDNFADHLGDRQTFRRTQEHLQKHQRKHAKKATNSAFHMPENLEVT